jgi:hypothetical protein
MLAKANLHKGTSMGIISGINTPVTQKPLFMVCFLIMAKMNFVVNPAP